MTARKIPAHDRWACFDCRWSAKMELVDRRASDRPSYSCPKCKKQMLWTGTAFRPPRRDDDEGWRIAQQIIAAGYRFRATRHRQRLPKKLSEVGQWLESQKSGRPWLAEKKLSLEKAAAGKLKIRSGPRTITDDEAVLVLHRGAWIEGRVKLHGDGHKPLSTPLIIVSSTRRNIPLTLRTRVRIRSRSTKRHSNRD
jgi:hypothetical protein